MKKKATTSTTGREPPGGSENSHYENSEPGTIQYTIPLMSGTLTCIVSRKRKEDYKERFDLAWQDMKKGLIRLGKLFKDKEISVDDYIDSKEDLVILIKLEYNMSGWCAEQLCGLVTMQLSGELFS